MSIRESSLHNSLTNYYYLLLLLLLLLLLSLISQKQSHKLKIQCLNYYVKAFIVIKVRHIQVYFCNYLADCKTINYARLCYRRSTSPILPVHC